VGRSEFYTQLSIVLYPPEGLASKGFQSSPSIAKMDSRIARDFICRLGFYRVLGFETDRFQTRANLSAVPVRERLGRRKEKRDAPPAGTQWNGNRDIERSYA
jgi:hypothetical protein